MRRYGLEVEMKVHETRMVGFVVGLGCMSGSQAALEELSTLVDVREGGRWFWCLWFEGKLINDSVREPDVFSWDVEVGYVVTLHEGKHAASEGFVIVGKGCFPHVDHQESNQQRLNELVSGIKVGSNGN